jgi:hypothetical protein
MNEHIEWLKGEFDKMLLAVLLALCVLGTIRAVHHNPPDTALITWLENMASNFSGALLALITRAVLKGNGSNGTAPPKA